MVKFKKNPLLESIAEFRWDPSSTVPHLLDINIEDFFVKFLDKAADKDFYKSERLLPKNIITFPSQPIYKIFNKNGKYMFYIGDGIFSIHALKPYDSWKEFQLIIEKGLDIFISCISESKNYTLTNFSSIDLRYINNFTPDILGDIKIEEFISEILKIDSKLPQIFKSDSNTIHVQNIQIVIPKNEHDNIVLIMRENINPITKEVSVIMDTIYFANINFDLNIEFLIDVLNKAHENITKSFIELTKPIHNKMEICQSPLPEGRGLSREG